jgi:hypothetical protein
LSSLPSVWIAAISMATITATQVNLSTCVGDWAFAHGASQAGVLEPALILSALVTGTIWPLRINLGVDAFAATCATTTAVLWLPWLILTEAPLELGALAAACFAAGAQLRWVAVGQAYDAYRRDVVWPRLWRESVRREVNLELIELQAAIEEPIEPFVSGDERGELSVARLATALASYTTLSPERREAAEIGRWTR